MGAAADEVAERVDLDRWVARLAAAGQRRFGQASRREALLAEYGQYARWADGVQKQCQGRLADAGQKPATPVQPEQAAAEVVQGMRGEVELAPQNSYIRMLQHQLAERFSLKSQSTGKEPNRRVKIFNG